MSPADQAKTKNKGLKIVIITIAVFIALVILAVIAIFFIGFKALSGPSDAAQDWFTQIRNDEITAAYNATADEFRAATSEDDMTNFLAAYPVVADNTDVNFNQFSIENNIAILSGTIKGAGESTPITVNLIRRDGTWQVTEISVNPEDIPETSGDSE